MEQTWLVKLLKTKTGNRVGEHFNLIEEDRSSKALVWNHNQRMKESFDRENAAHRQCRTVFGSSRAYKNSCSGMSKVKHSTSPLRLAVADLTLELRARPLPSSARIAPQPSLMEGWRRQWSCVQDCLCFVLLAVQQEKKRTQKRESVLPSSNREHKLGAAAPVISTAMFHLQWRSKAPYGQEANAGLERRTEPTRRQGTWRETWARGSPGRKRSIGSQGRSQC